MKSSVDILNLNDKAILMNPLVQGFSICGPWTTSSP